MLAFDEKCLARPIINDSGPQLSIMGFFTTGIRKRLTTSFSLLVCVYQPLRILAISPFLHTLVREPRRTCPCELHKIKRSNKKINEDKRISLLKASLLRLPHPLFLNRRHSFIFIHENRIMARAFKIQLSEAHSMASKSRFRKIGPKSRDLFISRRATMLNPNLCWLLTRNVWLVR